MGYQQNGGATDNWVRYGSQEELFVKETNKYTPLNDIQVHSSKITPIFFASLYLALFGSMLLRGKVIETQLSNIPFYVQFVLDWRTV